MNLLPAVLIGGPPHSGKSVLVYSLSQALRSRGVEHYALRAYPDGEGDWANQSQQDLVRAIRIKGTGTPEWIRRICHDIDRRHLPLIVDVGGRPTDWQETVFDQCTHAILLTPNDASHNEWEHMLRRHGMMIMADLHSNLHGLNALTDAGPLLRGTCVGLERGQGASGPAFETLVERIVSLFAYTPAELRDVHQRQSPVELVLKLDQLGRTLDALDDQGQWIPATLPQVLDYLPSATPLGVYDRGPNWLYAALALLAYPEPFYQFDVRLGWVASPSLGLGEATHDSPLQACVHSQSDHTRIEFKLPENYLDYADADELCVPRPPSESGVVISGKLPLWLWTGIASAYASAPWVGIYQPRLLDQAVVVKSSAAQPAVGRLVYSPVLPN